MDGADIHGTRTSHNCSNSYADLQRNVFGQHICVDTCISIISMKYTSKDRLVDTCTHVSHVSG